MKTLFMATLRSLPLLALFWSASASAFYDPQVQRWVNRDPVGELGFEDLRATKEGRAGEKANLYAFVNNDAVGTIDPLGLKIWLCTRNWDNRPVALTRHAYLWNDKSNSSCGRNNSGGGGPAAGNSGDLGPGKPGQICYQVEGSEGKEEQIMNCCKATANNGRWKPLINDCHTSAVNCIEKSGLKTPRHSRFNGDLTYKEDPNMGAGGLWEQYGP